MTVRNWMDRWENLKSEMKIVSAAKSNDGLTFEGLLRATGLSRSVLYRHLKKMTAPKGPILVREGGARMGRKYKISPFMDGIFARHTQEEAIDAVMLLLLSSVPRKTLRNPDKRKKVVEELKRFGRETS
jgi:hypothetical protein